MQVFEKKSLLENMSKFITLYSAAPSFICNTLIEALTSKRISDSFYRYAYGEINQLVRGQQPSINPWAILSTALKPPYHLVNYAKELYGHDYLWTTKTGEDGTRWSLEEINKHQVINPIAAAYRLGVLYGIKQRLEEDDEQS